MPRRLVRLVLALATTLAAWLVAMPAHAAAPFCDDRGASTLAPSPELPSPQTFIDVRADDEGCSGGLVAANDLQEGHGSSPSVAPSGLEATLPSALRVAHAAFTILPAPHAARHVVGAGVHPRVDRPPRTPARA